MNREDLKEQGIDQDFLEDAPTDLLIEVAAAKDSWARAVGAELDLIMSCRKRT